VNGAVRPVPPQPSATTLDPSSRRLVAMSSNNAGAAGGGAIYALGIFGAWVWFWQQADTFLGYLLAILQGLFWPAFMVYEVFKDLAG
jgi:hypothetical protein